MAFSRALIGVVARSAGARAAPVFAGIGIIGAVLLGPTGMRPSSLVHRFESSMGFRLGLLGVWLVLIAPAYAAMYRDRGCDYLRSLPAPAAAWWSVLGAAGLVLQVPAAALFVAGGTAIGALGVVTVCAAMCSLLATRARWWSERLIGWAVVACLGYFAVAQPVAYWSIVAAPAFLLATVVSWDRAPDRAGPWDPVSVRGGPVVALVLAHVTAVWRSHRASVGRAFAIAGLGAAVSALVARANQLVGVGEVSAFTMVVSAITLSIVAGILAAPVQEAHRELRWLMDSSGARVHARAAATSGVLAVTVGLLGAAHGGAACWAVGSPVSVGVSVCGIVAAWAVGFGLFAARAARWCETVDGVDGTRLVSLMVGCTVGAMVLLGWLGVLAAAVWSVAGLAAAATAIGAAPSARARVSRVRRW